jgi:hypothetical protein
MLHHKFPELLAAGNVPLQRFLLELRDEPRSGRYAHVGGDKDLLDPLPKLLVLRVPELRHGGVELPDKRLPAPPHAPPQTAEPGADGIFLGGRLYNLTYSSTFTFRLCWRGLHRFVDWLQHGFDRSTIHLLGNILELLGLPFGGLDDRTRPLRLIFGSSQKAAPRPAHNGSSQSPVRRFDTTTVAPEASGVTP